MVKTFVVPRWEDLKDEHKFQSLRKKFIPNYARFKEFEDKLRDHQLEAILNCLEVKAGQVLQATSTGKTYEQIWLIVSDMIDKSRRGEVGTYVMAAHRLTLCTQLFNDILSLIIPCGIRADMIYVGSEKYNFSKLSEKYKDFGFLMANVEGEQTTHKDEISTMVESAHSNGKHAMIVSTYHSFHQLAGLSRIDIATLDEVHESVEERFRKNIEAVRHLIDRMYSFTATKTINGDYGGQNDESFYGPPVFEFGSKQAQDAGEVVRPLIYTLRIDPSAIKNGKLDIGNKMAIKSITDGFEGHKQCVKRISCLPDAIGAKLLVTVDGLEELHAIHNHEDFRAWCGQNDIRTFAFSSDKGCFVDFKECPKLATLEKMIELADNADAIIFHYDMLSEGINLPSITGVLLMRDPPNNKVYQIVSRAGRLFSIDRANLYSEKILPGEYGKMVKPRSFVLIPEYPGGIDSKSLKEKIEKLRDEFGVPIEDIGQLDKAVANKEEILERLNKKSKIKLGIEYPLEHLIENMKMERVLKSFRSAENKTKWFRELDREE